MESSPLSTFSVQVTSAAHQGTVTLTLIRQRWSRTGGRKAPEQLLQEVLDVRDMPGQLGAVAEARNLGETMVRAVLEELSEVWVAAHDSPEGAAAPWGATGGLVDRP
jgi:hypothetical protein